MKSKIYFAALLGLLIFSPIEEAVANPTPKEVSVLAEALDLMIEAKDLHEKNRTLAGQDIDEIFGKNLEKLKQKGVVTKATRTFMGDKSAGTYKIGKNMEIWIRKQTRGTKTSLDMVIWEFKHDKSGKLTSIKGKGLDTYTKFNPDYGKPVVIDSRVKRSLGPESLSIKDAKTQPHKSRSHFGRKITTGQETVNDISKRLKGLKPKELKKLKIPGIEKMDIDDFKKVHVEMVIDQKESFLWADKAKKSADVYDDLRKIGASRNKLYVENQLKEAKQALAKAKIATGPDAAKKLAEAEYKLKEATKKISAADEFLKNVDGSGKKPPKAKTPKPKKIKPFKLGGGGGGAIMKGLAVLGVAGTVLTVADVVYAARELSNSAIIKGPRGIEKRFEEGKFNEAKRYWKKKVVSDSTRLPVADRLKNALQRASAGFGTSVVAINFDKLMNAIYIQWEKEAKKNFEEYKVALEQGPVKYEELPSDADIRVVVIKSPADKVLAGEKVAVKAKIVVFHKLANYSQPVVGAPIYIDWKGPNQNIKKIKTNEKGEFEAGNFIAGKTVPDKSLGKNSNRTKQQSAYHELVLAIVEKLLIKRIPVEAFDYRVNRVSPPKGPDIAHANDKDSILFEFKLQKHFVGEDGGNRLKDPIGYKEDFNKIGIYGGDANSGFISISLNGKTYRDSLKAVPDENNGLFKVYAKSKSPGPNLIRLYLRGGKFKTSYSEVGRYPMDFKSHPVHFHLTWGDKMSKYITDKHVIFPKVESGASVKFPLQVIALSNVNGKPVEGAKIEIAVDPEDGVYTAYTSYLPTDANGEGVYKNKKPIVYRVNSKETRIIANSKGATNTLFAYTSGRVPDKLGQSTLIDQGAYTRVFKGDLPKSKPVSPEHKKKISEGKGRIVLIARDAANKNIEPRVSIRRAGTKDEFTYSWGGRYIDLVPGSYDAVFDYTPDIIHRGINVSSGSEVSVEAGGYGRIKFEAKDALGKNIEPRVSIRRAGEKNEFTYSWGGEYIDLPPGKYDIAFDYTPDIEHKNISFGKGVLIIVQAGGYGRLELKATDALGKAIEPRVSIRRAGEKNEFTYSWGGEYIDLPPGKYDIAFDYTPDIEKMSIVLERGKISTISAGGYGRLQLNAKDALGKAIEPRVSIRRAGEKNEFTYSWGGEYIDLPPGRYDVFYDYTPYIKYRNVHIRKGKIKTLMMRGR